MMIECEKKSKLRCLNCGRQDCDMWKITKILDDLGILNGGAIDEEKVYRR